jgi:hypothetical protein
MHCIKQLPNFKNISTKPSNQANNKGSRKIKQNKPPLLLMQKAKTIIKNSEPIKQKIKKTKQ